MVAVTNSPFGQSTLPIVYSDVTCSGSETNILECGRKLHGTFECPTDNTAGVICSDAQVVCRQLEYNSEGIPTFYEEEQNDSCPD